MSVLWMYLKVFLVGGALCAVGELLVLRTRLTPARILVCYIIVGVLLSAIGVYGPLADFAGAGATVPLTGFGHALCQGVMGAVDEIGLIGAFTGGLSATAGGIAAAVAVEHRLRGGVLGVGMAVRNATCQAHHARPQRPHPRLEADLVHEAVLLAGWFI